MRELDVLVKYKKNKYWVGVKFYIDHFNPCPTDCDDEEHFVIEEVDLPMDLDDSVMSDNEFEHALMEAIKKDLEEDL